MNAILFPPMAFFLVLLFTYIVFKIILPKPTLSSDKTAGKFEPYACGEDVEGKKAMPNYDQFFPFAIFFTLLHVAGLMLATWSFYPMADNIFPIVTYSAGILIILSILFTG